jgi:hypothetical protein
VHPRSRPRSGASTAPRACPLNGGSHLPSCPRTQYLRPRRVFVGTGTSTLLVSVALVVPSALSTAAYAFHFLDGARSHASSATPARPRSHFTSPVRLDRASRALTCPLSYYWTRVLRLRSLPARAGALVLPRKGLAVHKYLKTFSFLVRPCTLYRLFPSLHFSPRGSLEGPYIFSARVSVAPGTRTPGLTRRSSGIGKPSMARQERAGASASYDSLSVLSLTRVCVFHYLRLPLYHFTMLCCHKSARIAHCHSYDSVRQL